jgi:hypothetical protein
VAKYFTDAEVAGLDHRLVARLDRARGYAGVPFEITSGKRTEEENAAAGGVKNSAHVRGLAVDLRCPGSGARYFMLKGLLAAGFDRIGVYDLHFHVDIDEALPARVCWVGTSH